MRPFAGADGSRRRRSQSRRASAAGGSGYGHNRGASTATPILMSVGWAAATQLCCRRAAPRNSREELQQFVPQGSAAGNFRGRPPERGLRLSRRARPTASEPDRRLRRMPDSACPRARSSRAALAARRTASPSSIIRPPRTSSTSTKICRSRTWKTRRRRVSIPANCSKRYSTVGMGPSQGKHSNMNALRILARYRGVGVQSISA